MMCSVLCVHLLTFDAFVDFFVSRKWKEEQQTLLAEKDKEETTALDELRRVAQKELQDWYNHYDEQLGHTKTSNRSNNHTQKHTHTHTHIYTYI